MFELEFREVHTRIHREYQLAWSANNRKGTIYIYIYITSLY